MPARADTLRRTGGQDVKSIVFDAETIDRRVQQLGAEITAAFPDGELLVLGLLKGSFIFLGDLVRRIERPLQVDFIVASSYGRGVISSGQVDLLYDPETVLEGKHIVLVEDIVDSGNTLRRLLSLLAARGPSSVSICALLDKVTKHPPFPELRFVGFEAPTAFLVGYGLDHAENFRHLPFIADLM
jgi:hypoxanthine phosphoribosyltransferase